MKPLAFAADAEGYKYTLIGVKSTEAISVRSLGSFLAYYATHGLGTSSAASAV
jgi:hypothetical protein